MNKKETKKQQAEPLNPFEYGYKKGKKVELPAELFMAMLELTQVVIKNETEERIKIVSFDMGSQPKEQTEKVEVFVTPLGKRSGDIFENLMELHFKNIEKKEAIHLSQNKPILDNETK